MQDNEILDLYFARDEQAITETDKKHGAACMQVSMNILSSKPDAEECVNDTYLALWNAIPPEEPDPLCAYAYRVGRNIALKRLRSNTAAIRCAGYDLSLDELAECIPAGDLWEQMEARELAKLLNRFLKQQSAENRRLFLLRYWFGDSVQEIGKQLGMKPGTVSVRLNRIRAALKDYLSKEGFPL